jgi:hypothetical protein
VAHRRFLVLLAGAAMLVALAPAPAAVASGKAPPGAAARPAAGRPASDMTTGLPHGKKYKPLVEKGAHVQALGLQDEPPPAGETPPYKIGDTKTWAGLDDVEGAQYLKDYTLRAVGQNIEVWVASDTDEVSTGIRFPEGDCRNDERTQLTDQQLQELIDQYDTNMLPKESAAFSTAPPRDGTKATLPADLDLPADYYKGAGNKVVTLVDNVRDANFYDQSLATGKVTYIAGFFAPLFNQVFDRNVMTIDAYDWIHRTGATPPDEPVEGNLCASKPARPYAYESTFAHEYQHLLESYQDPAETSWINEGLSMYAEVVTGYATPDIPIDKVGTDAYIQCLLGNSETVTPANPNPRPGGPENSLTVWGDQGDESEILCDYGAAFSFMLYLDGRFGDAFLSELHRDKDQGLASVDKLLKAHGVTGGVRPLLHQWAAMIALDAPLEGKAKFYGGNRKDYSTPTLHAAVNWANDDAYATPGAPPNGSDYVRLRNAQGAFVNARDVHRIDFEGAANLPTTPVEWTVDANAPDHAGNPALYSGRGDNFDRAIIHPVTVPATNATLTFDARWDTEAGWDFGFVQVSTDNGATWTSLPATSTTSEHDPGALPTVVANLPGYSGDSAAWVPQTADLSAYAGRSVLLSFRYITDPNTGGDGFWVDNVAVGGTVLSDGSSLAGWRSASEVRPTPVAGYTVQLVGYSSTGRAPVFIEAMPLRDNRAVSIVAPWGLAGRGVDVVAAIVTYDEPTEAITAYAPYTLRVNGVVQPGGSAVAAPPVGGTPSLLLPQG